MSPWRKLQYAGVAAILVVYVAHVSLLDARLQDDAFISFRYARNLAEGAGLVWNVGERVEGYTNFLWTLLLALPFALSKSAEPVLYARALSVVSGATAIVASYLLVRRLAPKSAVLPLIAPLLLAGSWPFAVNTMTGLETVFFSALLTVGALLGVVELDDLRYRGSSVIFALAALTRPEAIGLFALLCAALGLGLRGRGADARRYLLRLAIPFAAIAGAHAVFRLAYYGSIVPNTFTAKFGAGLPPGMSSKGDYIRDFLSKGLDPYYVFTALAALFLAARFRRLWAWVIAVGALFGFVNVAVSGADFMIGFRYFIPYLPLLYVAAALGVGVLVERWLSYRGGSDREGPAPARARSRVKSKRGPAARRDAPAGADREPPGFWVEAAFLLVAVAEAATGYMRSRDVIRPFEELRRRVSVDTSDALGTWLSANLPPETRVAAVDIGALGFYSRLPVLDLSGLTDPAIARLPGDLLDRRLDIDDFLRRDVGAIVLVSRAPGPPGAPGPLPAYFPPGVARLLLTDPRVKESFQFTARYPSYTRLERSADGAWRPAEGAVGGREGRNNTYFMELFLRPNLAAAASGEPAAHVR